MWAFPSASDLTEAPADCNIMHQVTSGNRITWLTSNADLTQSGTGGEQLWLITLENWFTVRLITIGILTSQKGKHSTVQAVILGVQNNVCINILEKCPCLIYFQKWNY